MENEGNLKNQVDIFRYKDRFLIEKVICQSYFTVFMYFILLD